MSKRELNGRAREDRGRGPQLGEIAEDNLITLYVNHFTHSDERRRAEYDECLRRNTACRFIDKIVVLAESTPEHRIMLSHPKIEWIDSPRSTFRRFFDEINCR